MTHDTLLLLSVVIPIACAAVAWVVKVTAIRNVVVVLGCLGTAAAGLGLVTMAAKAGAPLTASVAAPWFGHLGLGLELGLGALVAGLGIARRRPLITLIGLGCLAATLTEAWLHHRHGGAAAPASFLIDGLAATLVAVISVVGSLIVLFGIGYMEKHEHHAPAGAASNGRFFFFLLGFLGVMNLLVTADSLRWLTVAWECTSLCSFFLIGHDNTPVARTNADRALLINGFGGLAMTVAAAVAVGVGGEATLAWISCHQVAAMTAMALLGLAALTKSAQLPFQSWLLGAMVAPTPVSALLHSATLVKAGSYLILRLSPAFAGTAVLDLLAIAGALTFAVTSALAVTQSNGKKVLAYSTIANLGMIVACAGIATPLAHTAALAIIGFHAVSKALLFLCVGTVEQEIGSRDIEDMGNLMWRMPFTAWVMVIGMVSMLMPPFGMLLAKWMSIEAAIGSPVLLVLLAAGSALTVWFWCKWLGRVQTTAFHTTRTVEKLPVSMVVALATLGLAVVAAGPASLIVVRQVLAPIARAAYGGAGPAIPDSVLLSISSPAVWFLLIVPAAALAIGWLIARSMKPSQIALPYLCGENVPLPAGIADGAMPTFNFRSVGDQVHTAWSVSMYGKGLLHEGRITLWSNLAAIILLLLLFSTLVTHHPLAGAP